MNRAELKSAAKSQIKGKIGTLLLITLVIGLISGLASALGAIPVVGIFIGLLVTFVITPAFSLSTIRIYLDVSAGGTPTVNDAFSGFSDFWAAFKNTFLVGLFTTLWSLLLFIPGIVKGYSYSMSMYILAENPGKPALECISESKELTYGHKMELFLLDLSFLGWILLTVITFGIAGIWTIPYMSTTSANAYRWLKEQK